MRLKLNHTQILDVYPDEMGGGSNRIVFIQVSEEDLFEMFDQIKPSNIIKYLDMRGIQHREPSQINIYQCNTQRPTERNKRKLKRLVDEQDRLRKLVMS